MVEGAVPLWRRWYFYAVLVVAFFAPGLIILFPLFTSVILFMTAISIGIIFSIYQILRHEKLRETEGRRRKTHKTKMVEGVVNPGERVPDLQELAHQAAQGPKRVKGHVIEGSGMELVERFIPLGEMLFPISFVVDRTEQIVQQGSLEVGKPLCLWHQAPVNFEPVNGGRDGIFRYKCGKCMKEGLPITKSPGETTKVIETIARNSLETGKLPLRSETLLEAVKRGSGELPG